MLPKFFPSDFEPYDDEPDQKEKRGLRHFAGLILQNFSHLFLAGLLALMGMIPLTLGGVLGIWSENWVLVSLSGAVGGALAGPFFACLLDTIFRGIREDYEKGWHFWRVTLKENGWQSAKLGALFGFLGTTQLFVLIQPLAPTIVRISVIAGLLFETALLLFSFFQIVLVKAGIRRILENALRFTLAYGLKILLWSIILVFYLLLMLRTLPGSVPLILIFNLWLPMQVLCYIFYPTLDDVFHLVPNETHP